MNKLEKAIMDLEMLEDYAKGLSNVTVLSRVVLDALELLRAQRNMVDIDALKKELNFGESCDKCDREMWCSKNACFSMKDFCEILDDAIKEIKNNG